LTTGGDSLIRGAVFDLDGTVLNTVPALKKSMDLALREFGLGEVTEDEVKVFVGNGSLNYVKRAFGKFGIHDPETVAKAAETYRKHFAVNCMYGVQPYEGVPEALAFLKKQGLKLAVLSNKPQQQTEDNIFPVYGRELFDLVTGERPDVPLKPDPRGLRMTLDTLGLRAEECLYFGDTRMDMETGVKGGCVTVGVLWGFRGPAELAEQHPYAIISTPFEIQDVYRLASAEQ